jgi:hypothetical protein
MIKMHGFKYFYPSYGNELKINRTENHRMFAPVANFEHQRCGNHLTSGIVWGYNKVIRRKHQRGEINNPYLVPRYTDSRPVGAQGRSIPMKKSGHADFLFLKLADFGFSDESRNGEIEPETGNFQTRN